jgi:hypothetical protein
LSDKAIDSTIGNEKIGVAECDEVFDFSLIKQNRRTMIRH